MLENILSKILSNEILTDDAVEWLSSSNIPNDLLQGVNKIDLANFFLAYLREQAHFLETRSSRTPSNTPIKGNLTPSVPALDLDNLGKKLQIRRSCSRKLPLSSENKNERCSPEPIEGQSRRQAKLHRPGPHQITLGNFIVTKTSQRERKNARASINLNSNEEFPEIGNTKKRIKPVLISSSNDFLQQENQQPNPFNSAPEVNASDVAVERTLLKMECLKVQNKEAFQGLQTLQGNQEQLDTLSRLYASILNHDLELNFMNEIYFLTELLCVQIKPEEEKPTEIFGNSRNCGFFAAKTLGLLKNFLEHLDSALMKLFAENRLLEEVCPDIVLKLKTILPGVQNRTPVSLHSVIGAQVENENKKNFSSPEAFQVYRKQRDTFYALLEDWDNERHFSKALAKEVFVIFDQAPSEPENFAYFCRLFVSQLICSCIGDGSNGVSKTPLHFQVDPERLKRLHERLVTPARALLGPCPLPEFSGWEEFFRDFIVIASSANFNTHLQDAFVSRLHELNSQKFELTELHPNSFVVEEETKTKFLACVVSAQLVAKFLGFVQFQPYRQLIKKLPEQVVVAQMMIREKVNPIIDIHDVLTTAEKDCKLILTVPWLCSYLVQMDIVTLRMSVVQATISLLISLLRGLPHRALPGTAMLLVRLNIGWCLTILGDSCPNVFDVCRNITNFQNSAKALSNPDYIDLVDSKCISSVCPFISELRSILAGTSGNVRSSQSIGPKHITPTAAVTIDPALQLELQLESSFIQSQPSNVRQTLEFITDRLNALCTDYLEVDILTPGVQELEAKVQTKVQTEAKNLDPNLEFAERKAGILKNVEFWASAAADEHSAVLLEKCLKRANAFVADRCLPLLVQLLPRSVSAIQSNAFAQIICKNICAKIKTWVQTNYGSNELQKKAKEFTEKAAKQRVKSGDNSSIKVDPNVSLRLPADRRGLHHLESALPPADLLINFRELILKMDNQQAVVCHDIESVISATEMAMCHREDLIPVAHYMLKALTVDLAVSLVASQPELLTADLLFKFTELWSGSLGRPDQIDRMFCPRYMKLLCESRFPQQSWAAYKKLLLGLVKAKLLVPGNIEEQAVGVLQQEWPPSFLEMYTICINDLAREAGSSKQDSDEEGSFTQLLPWLAGYCSNLDDLPGE